MSRFIKVVKQSFPYRCLCSFWEWGTCREDKKLGVDLSSWCSQENAGFSAKEGNQYQPSTRKLKSVLKKLKITDEDSIIDIGCGKGKAMYLMSQFPFHAIDGVDLSQRLCDTAQTNFTKLHLSQCHVFCADALNFDDYDSYNYFYIFNSFPEEIFKVMLDHINNSLRRNPRGVVLIYLHPVCHDLITADDTFKEFYRRKSFIDWFEYRCYRNE